jgi:hypothetical protein
MYSKLYRSDWIAAGYCNLDEIPREQKGIWMHGWSWKGTTEIIRPEQLFGIEIQTIDTPLFVATNHQEKYLKNLGYHNAKAIGLPIIYTKKNKVVTKSKSLLVMPQHTIKGMSHDEDIEDTYVEYIQSVKGSFDECTICIGAHDYDNGIWKNSFEKKNFNVIRGADWKEINTLQVQCERMMGYSHMTTNGIGSHVVYAASLGVKVSIAGPYYELTKDALANVEFYKRKPNIIENAVKRVSCEEVSKELPWLFVNPIDAAECREWGLSEIGNENKVPPIILKRLFGWNQTILKPNHISISAWSEHAPFALWLIGYKRPKVLVELGSHTGFSYFSFCQAVVDHGLGTQCYCVDTWQGEDHAGHYDNSIFETFSEYHDKYFSVFSRKIRKTFDEASVEFSNDSIDLLHIDGLHSYEAVKRDYDTWLPKVKDGGVILFHDISVKERGFGVWKLWDEIKSEAEECLEFSHSNGLGVLVVNKKRTNISEKLFPCDVNGNFNLVTLFEDVSKMAMAEELKALDLQNIIQSMKSSKCWKMTSPVRLIDRLLRKWIWQ